MGNKSLLVSTRLLNHSEHWNALIDGAFQLLGVERDPQLAMKVTYDLSGLATLNRTTMSVTFTEEGIDDLIINKIQALTNDIEEEPEVEDPPLDPDPIPEEDPTWLPEDDNQNGSDLGEEDD